MGDSGSSDAAALGLLFQKVASRLASYDGRLEPALAGETLWVAEPATGWPVTLGLAGDGRGNTKLFASARVDRTLLGQKLMTKTLDELLEAAIPGTLGGDAAGTEIPVLVSVLDEWGREPWTGWTPVVVPTLATMKPAEVGGWIQGVVAAEGPVVAGRVFALVSRASGAPKQSASVVEALESGLASAVRRGDVVVLPGRRGAPETRTLRLPSQPEALPRVPGDRAPAEIPKAELADLAARVTSLHADWDRVAVKREVARLVGIGRYTDAAD